MPNEAADKPRAVKPQAFPAGVGLIRVVVRRFAQAADRIRRPVVVGAKRWVLPTSLCLLADGSRNL